VAIADTDPERIAAVGVSHNVPGRYLTLTEMLKHEKLDVVSIATPNFTHKPLTIEALRAGCHVMCEKPLAMSSEDAADMVRVSKETGKRVMVNFTLRSSEEAYAMKQAVDSGMLGDIYYARSVWLRRQRLPGFGGWFGQKELSGGGPLIDIGVHRLDLALWLMGFPKPVWVMGSTYDYLASEIAQKAGKKFDVEDFATAMIKFENGATLELEASWCAHIKEREHTGTRLFGTKGGLHHHNIGDVYDSFVEFYVERGGCQYDMKLHPPVPQAKTPMYEFIDAILNDAPHPSGLEEGLASMRILDAIYESARTGEPVYMQH